MFKNLIIAAGYGLVFFALEVVLSPLLGAFGTHQIHFTHHHIAEDAAVYTSIGLFLGLPSKGKNQLCKNAIHAIAFGFVMFWLTVLIQHFVGVHEYHLTRYPAAEDAALYTALGLFLGLAPQKKQVGASRSESEGTDIRSKD